MRADDAPTRSVPVFLVHPAWFDRWGTELNEERPHEYLRLEEVGDGAWSLSFHDRLLARFDVRDWKLRA